MKSLANLKQMLSQNQNIYHQNRKSNSKIYKRMKTITNILRPLISINYLLIMGFFFLTFFDFKCNDQKVASSKGIDYVINKKLYEDAPRETYNSNRSGQPDRVSAGFNVWAISALACALIGLFFFLANCKSIINPFWGLIGTFSLIGLYNNISSKISENENFKVLNIEIGIGYTLSLIGFVIAIVLTTIVYIILKNEKDSYANTINNEQVKTTFYDFISEIKGFLNRNFYPKTFDFKTIISWISTPNGTKTTSLLSLVFIAIPIINPLLIIVSIVNYFKNRKKSLSESELKMISFAKICISIFVAFTVLYGLSFVVLTQGGFIH